MQASNMVLKSSVFMLFLLSLVAGESNHDLGKRQVGVLARSGALPQGKRSVEALARNGELPVASNDRQKNEDYVLDLLIEELGTAEGLSRLRLQALAEKLENEQGDMYDEYEDAEKRSLVYADRNSELPQKRMPYPKSGYLIRPKQTSNEESNLPDTEDFLGKGGFDVLTVNGGFNVADNGLASFAKHGYEDNVEDVYYFANYDEDYPSLDDNEKRHLGTAQNFFGDRNVASRRNTAIPGGKGSFGSALNFGKRNLDAAEDFLFSVKKNVGAAKNFLLSGGKRNIGAAKNFGIKSNVDTLNGKRNLASFAKQGAFYNVEYPSLKDYDLEDGSDSGGSYEQEQKRNLGSFKNFGKRSVGQVETLTGFFDREITSKMQNNTGRNTDREGNKRRGKREAFPEPAPDELPMPMYQTSSRFYYETPDLEVRKRFLGSVAPQADNEEEIQIVKRHIGALARLGWLPSFRSTRYSRSGRAIENKNNVNYRSNTPVGSCPTKNTALTWTSPPSVAPKMGLGVRGIFRRVGRSISGGDNIPSRSTQRY